jgi:hypothetical protein
LADGNLVTRYHQQLCAGVQDVTEALFLSSLEVLRQVGLKGYADILSDGGSPDYKNQRRESTRWLRYCVEYRLVPTELWRRGIRIEGDNVLVIYTEATARIWSKIGFTPDDRLSYARGLLTNRAWSLKSIARVLSLDGNKTLELAQNFDAGRWLESEFAAGRVTQSTPAAFYERLCASLQAIPEAERARRLVQMVQGPLAQILINTSVSYALFQQIYAVAESQLRALRSQQNILTIDPSLATSLLGRLRLQRFQKDLNRQSLRDWRTDRAMAQDWQQVHLARDSFATAQDFVDHYQLARIYPLPNPQDFPTKIAYQRRLRLIAEQYFAHLRSHLQLFFDLQPNAEQFRWLLETPTQFPLALHHDVPRSIPMAPAWQRPLLNFFGIRQAFDLNTSADIFYILKATLNIAMTRVQSINDWIKIATARVPEAQEYVDLFRKVFEANIEVAFAFGDADLAWLDTPALEEAQAGFSLASSPSLNWLFVFRAGLPAAERSDALLTAVAAQWLTGDQIHSYATRRAQQIIDRNGNPDGLRPSPRSIQVYQDEFELALLNYLTGRSMAGTVLNVQRANWLELAEVAREHGFRAKAVGKNQDQIQYKIWFEKK